MFFTDYPQWCPSQEQKQYAFKIYALREAIAQGFRHVLWMDSAFQPIASIEPLWAAIERDGWYIPPQLAEKLGRWCSDAALAKFGIDRAEAYRIPLVYSGLVGMDLDSEKGRAIWEGWQEMYELGSFDGPHKNIPGAPMTAWGNKWEGHVSDDPEVQGHRHDESALSFVLHRVGLVPQKRGYLTIEGDPRAFIGHHVRRG